MKKFAIIYFDVSYKDVVLCKYCNTSRRTVKAIPTDIESEDEVEEWLDSLENELAKEILEQDIKFRDNVTVYITNIVRL